MDAVVAFIASGEATKPVEPGERALGDPAEGGGFLADARRRLRKDHWYTNNQNEKQRASTLHRDSPFNFARARIGSEGVVQEEFSHQRIAILNCSSEVE
jgi:hypothetical protein